MDSSGRRGHENVHCAPQRGPCGKGPPGVYSEKEGRLSVPLFRAQITPLDPLYAILCVRKRGSVAILPGH